MLDKAQLLVLSTPHGAKMKDLSMQAKSCGYSGYSAVQGDWGTFEQALTVTEENRQ